MAKASRVAIKTAKSVLTLGERLAAVEVQLVAVEAGLLRVEKVLSQLVAAGAVDRPSVGKEAPKILPMKKTVRKGG